MLAHAGGEDGLDIVRRILSEAPKHLTASGTLICEVGGGRPLLEEEFPHLPFVWLDTEDTAGEVFLLRAGDFGPRSRGQRASDRAPVGAAGWPPPAKERAPSRLPSPPRPDRLDWSSNRRPVEARMQAQGTPKRAVARRLVAAVRTFARSDVGGRAKLMFAAILALLLAANGLNVANSFVNRNLMSAIEERHVGNFIRQAQFTLALFAASTIVAVFARFAEERLGLLWREYVTERCIGAYLANGTYHRLASSGELTNPDQRIAEDVRAFTATTLSFSLMAINSAFTILSFSGVLWSISPLLYVISVLYATLGSYLTIKLARPLVRLNSDQLDREASFRSALIHVRDNAESIRQRSDEASEPRGLASGSPGLSRISGASRQSTAMSVSSRPATIG